MNAGKVFAFLGLTFAISWTTALVFHLLGADLSSIQGTLLLVAFFMWAPALSALAVQRWSGQPIRASLGLARGRLRWSAVAWLAPVALLGLTILVGLAFPDVSFTTDHRAFLEDLGLPEEDIDASMALLEGLPVPPIVLFIAQGLVAGLTINALAALGEEAGWRGLLLTELAPLGFWRVSAITGVVWGIWHAPIILQGHNFPQAPAAGVAMMTAWTLAGSPIFTYLTVRARSVMAPTLFHGTFNALGFLSVVYLDGAGNLWIAPVGAAGIGAAIIGLGLCVAHDRWVAGEAVTDGRSLAPWSPPEGNDPTADRPSAGRSGG